MCATPNPCAPPIQIRDSGTPLNKVATLRAKSEFQDAAHWDELADRLTRYRLPTWDQACSPEAMRPWFARIGISPNAYREATQTSPEDFCQMNPTWPLAAWVGLLLEMRGASR